MARTITVDEYVCAAYKAFEQHNIQDKDNEDMIAAEIADVLHAAGKALFGESEYSNAVYNYAHKNLLLNLKNLAEEYGNDNT